ncbi:carbohydrate ABC transporter permease [Jiangella asiatica]|uniref:Sugar ABC transporter permease n=1 Tax=Jiangella asiatica TaxID=2530372 RepID=A0A4R5D4M2_9ACTN|nr:sugar ABC transporter permease [Jiangella asiatica]TDE08256.1 sugar ABC transporter permease [Jiangella asiatica]
MSTTEYAIRPPETVTGEASAKRRRRSENRAGYLFLAPWLIGLVVITLGPMIASLYLSFTEYSLIREPVWVGLQNYIELFTENRRFLNTIRVTAIYVAVGVPLQLMFALALALVLDRGVRGLSVFRAIFYLPSLLGGSVAVALLWRQVFGRDGLFNAVLGIFGIEGQSWIGSPDTALWTLILLLVWQFGSPMVIFLAGLRQIPTELYEAAEVDGAGRVRKFVSITLPLLSPIIFFNIVLQMIGAFQAFTSAYVVSGGTGGPNDSTLFYTLYLYQEGFQFLRMGSASAMAWILLVVIGAVTAVNFIASRYWVFYNDR